MMRETAISISQVNAYAAPRRDAPILPGRVVFVDDLPAGTPASFSVQTSPTSRHGYYREMQASDVVLLTVGEVAAQLGVSK